MQKRIGAFPGKFLPPHIGHLNQITECSKMVDQLWVIVAENKKITKKICIDSNFPIIPVRLRIKWLKKHFKHNKNIKIKYMNEKSIPAFPDGLDKWSKRFKKKFKGVNVKFADPSYEKLNSVYFPECEFVAFDRTVNPISATIIRNNPVKNMELIIPEGQKYIFDRLKK